MLSIYRPRRARASPLWQIVHHAWAGFVASYERAHRTTHGPLQAEAIRVAEAFYRCGDLSAGFTRLQCQDCGHERLLAFTCKGHHFCPACHQRRTRQMGDWIATSLCHAVPHRQFVFTIPRPLRGIFRKRRHLLGLLFCSAIESLRDWFRARLDLPDGKIAAVAAVQTFGDYLVFHPHLHVLAATGLFDSKNRFHLLPVETVQPLAELFRHRFLAILRRENLISEKTLRDLLGWKHSGFNLNAGDKPIAANNTDGLRGIAEYLLRAPFSLEKITWHPATRSVIYRSSRNWRTKRNFEVFSAGDFLAAAIQHIPPKGQQTIRYYGIYSNKHRGMGRFHRWAPTNRQPGDPPSRPPSATVPPPPRASARALRPLWRDLILRVFGEDPLECPCCKGTMKTGRTMIRREEVEFFLRLHGLWEGVTGIPPPPEPPYNIETMEPIRVPSAWRQSAAAGETHSPLWLAPELPLDEGRVLVLDADPPPPDAEPVFATTAN